MSLTAAQIVATALSIAKCPGYTSLGGQQLNLVLSDLVLHRDLKVNLIPSTLVITPGTYGPFNLPANYQRTYDIFFYIDGTPFFLTQGSLRQYDQEPQLAGLSNWPYEFATDLSDEASGGVGKLYVYPQADSTISCTHRYYTKQADIVTPETSATVPWFEDQDYLIQATATRLMRITDDDRYLSYQAEAEKMLSVHLIMEGDEQQVVKEVGLDPRRFKLGGSSKPTKLDPW